MAAKTRLRAARDAYSWTQSRLVHELMRRAKARDLRVPTVESLKTELSRWENGHKTPDEAYRALFREIYGLTDEELGFDLPAAVLVVDSRPPIAPEPVTPALIGNLRGVLDQFARIDNLIGPRHLLAAVLDQTAFTEQLCQITTGPSRRLVLDVAAQFAEFTGWLHQDAGDLRTAMFWTDRALGYVQELGDPRMISYVLMRKSNIATDARQLGLGLGLAEAALRPNGQLTPRLRAVALRQQANAHAIVGDANACARILDDALRHITELAAQEPTGDVATYCTPAYLEMEAANCWLQLQKPAKAIPIFEQGLAEWPAGLDRDRGLCLSRLATAHALAGDLEAACAVAYQALAVMRAAYSARSLDQLRQLRIQLAPSRSVAVVAELDDAFAEFIRTTA